MAKGNGLFGGIGSSISNIFKFLFEGGLDTIKEKVHEAQIRIVRKIYSTLMMLAGILFVAIGAALMLPELFNISSGMAFLIMGLILIIIAFVIKSNTK